MPVWFWPGSLAPNKRWSSSSGQTSVSSERLASPRWTRCVRTYPRRSLRVCRQKTARLVKLLYNWKNFTEGGEVCSLPESFSRHFVVGDAVVDQRLVPHGVQSVFQCLGAKLVGLRSRNTTHVPDVITKKVVPFHRECNVRSREKTSHKSLGEQRRLIFDAASIRWWVHCSIV